MDKQPRPAEELLEFIKFAYHSQNSNPPTWVTLELIQQVQKKYLYLSKQYQFLKTGEYLELPFQE